MDLIIEIIMGNDDGKIAITREMPSAPAWKRLVRYVGEDGQVRLGDPQITDEDDILAIV